MPRLNSVTDTSYFPTDDLGNVNTQLDQVESVSAEKDLAFLGYDFRVFVPGSKLMTWMQFHFQEVYRRRRVWLRGKEEVIFNSRYIRSQTGFLLSMFEAQLHSLACWKSLANFRWWSRDTHRTAIAPLTDVKGSFACSSPLHFGPMVRIHAPTVDLTQLAKV